MAVPPNAEETKSLKAAFAKFMETAEGKVLRDAATAPAPEKVKEEFTKFLETNKAQPPMQAALDALPKFDNAALTNELNSAKAAAIASASSGVLKTAFTKFMETAEGASLRDAATPPEPKAVVEQFKAFVEKNKASPDMQAASAAMAGFTEDFARKTLKEAKDTEAARPKDKYEQAFEAFMKSKEGQATLAPGKDRGLMPAFIAWVKKNGEKDGANPPASPEAAAIVGEMNNAAVTAEITPQIGQLYLKKKKLAKTGPEEEESFFNKNKMGIIGGIVMAILGFMFGGVGGALLGGVLGFSGAGAMGDKKGMIAGFLDPEPASPTMAKPKTVKNASGTPETVIFIDPEGKATDGPVMGGKAVVGQLEGTGEDRKLNVTGVILFDADNYLRHNRKETMRTEPVSGVSLKATKGGNIDISTIENIRALAVISETAAKSAEVTKKQGRAELNVRRNENLVTQTETMRGSDGKTNKDQALANMQELWQQRISEMGVRPEDSVEIARKITEKMATPEFRKKSPQEMLDAVLETPLTGSGKKIGETLSDASRNGTGEKSLAGGGPDTLQLFKDAFNASSARLVSAFNERAGVDGLITLPPPSSVATAQAQADAARAAAERTRAAAAPQPLPDQQLDLMEAGKLAEKFPPRSAASGPPAPNPVAGQVEKALADQPGDAAKKRFMTIKSGNKSVTLVGSEEGGKFVATKAVVMTDGMATPVTKDIVAMPEEARSFATSGGKIAIAPGADANRGKMEALLSSREITGAAPDPGRSAPPPPRTSGRDFESFGP